MSGLFGIASSALKANQQALATVGQNIANVNTPGYARQRVEFTTGQGDGGGVNVSRIERSYSEWTTQALRRAQQDSGAAVSQATFLSSLESAIAPGDGGLGSAMSQYFDAFSDLAAQPTVRGVRAAALEDARALAERFKSLDGQLADLELSMRSELKGTTSRINLLTKQLAELNQIVQVSGLSPAVQDRQEQLLSELSFEVEIDVRLSSAGTVDVFLPAGLALTRGNQSFELAQVDVSLGSRNSPLRLEGTGRDPALLLEKGRLGGLLRAREETLLPLRRDLGRLAEAFAGRANEIHSAGFTAAGIKGGLLFGGNQTAVNAISDPSNTGGALVTATIEDAGASRSSAYLLSKQGAEFVLTRQSDGTEIFRGSETDLAAGTFDGMRLAIESGAVNAGDRFVVDPFLGAAGRLEVVLATPDELAFNRPSPDDEDQSAGAADGGQAVLLGEDVAIFATGERGSEAYAELVGTAGAASRQAQTSQEVAALSLTEATARRENFAGVNLDEEAADLIRFQQAYQAAARIINTADTIFQTILAAVR
jgi:flagellar hook-associated protein 1